MLLAPASLIRVLSLIGLLHLLCGSPAAAYARDEACPAEFSVLGEGRAFLALKAYSAEHEAISGHRVELRKGRRVVSIGFLQKENDQRFMRLVARAISAGEVDEVDAGTIVGPKALSLLTNIERLASKDRPLLVRGKIDIARLEKDLKDQLETVARGGEKVGAFVMPISPERLRRAGWVYSEEELAAYAEAKEVLGIKKACRKLQKVKKLRDCAPLKFSMDARDPASVRWKK